MIPAGQAFYKMSGSGNDFVVIDDRAGGARTSFPAELIQRICARGTGVGADGVVFLEASDQAAVRLTYLNADGSRADLCGNATLCTTRLAVELGLGAEGGFRIETDSGTVAARLIGGRPEIDLQPVNAVEAAAAGIAPGHGEWRVGFALVGVPHLVVQCDNVSEIDVVTRGRSLRHHASLSHGANVNFVSQPAGGRWRVRTYERGVEAETLACGSGAVATAILLSVWGEADGAVDLETTSGRILSVRLRKDGDSWRPSLAGEARVVYQGILSET